jgi:hypothetical protein
VLSNSYTESDITEGYLDYAGVKTIYSYSLREITLPSHNCVFSVDPNTMTVREVPMETEVEVTISATDPSLIEFT